MKNIWEYNNGSVLNFQGQTIWYKKIDGMYAQVFDTKRPDFMQLLWIGEEIDLVEDTITHEQFKEKYT